MRRYISIFICLVWGTPITDTKTLADDVVSHAEFELDLINEKIKQNEEQKQNIESVLSQIEAQDKTIVGIEEMMIRLELQLQGKQGTDTEVSSSLEQLSTFYKRFSQSHASARKTLDDDETLNRVFDKLDANIKKLAELESGHTSDKDHEQRNVDHRTVQQTNQVSNRQFRNHEDYEELDIMFARLAANIKELTPLPTEDQAPTTNHQFVNDDHATLDAMFDRLAENFKH